MQQRDYIERMIQQIAAAIAALLGKVAAGELVDAERDLDAAWSSLGLRRRDVLRLDDATVCLMLASKAELAARLALAQASLEEARGARAEAEALRARAAAWRAGNA
jgi:hypothetical protein